MNRLRVLYHLMRADFLERVRRYNFLVLLGLTIFVGYAFVPPVSASYAVLNLGGYRGIYNSAWIGTMLAVLTSVWLAIFGFFPVKNAIERDYQTGVGQIIATTPCSKFLYVAGKAVSNFAVLAIMVVALAGTAIIMQLVRGEDRSIDLVTLLAPFVFVTLPTMAMVAALAVLFESISWLRGGLGNVIYLVLMIIILMISLAVITLTSSQQTTVATQALFGDMLGIIGPLTHMTTAAKASFPAYDGTFAIGITAVERPFQTFRWEGTQWTGAIALGRLVWVGIAFAVTASASIFFHRFDPSREQARLRKEAVSQPEEPEAEVIAPLPTMVRLSALPTRQIKNRFGQLLISELRLLLKDVRWWWYLVAIGLIIGGGLTPPEVGRQLFLPLAWIWPLLIWSSMGSREIHYRTHQMLFSAVKPIQRQLPAQWIAGLLVTIIMGSGVLLRFVTAGDWVSVGAWSVGALFIPSLALALGAWSNSSKLFEVVYTLMWYLGPANELVPLDFIGVTQAAIEMGLPIVYFVITLVLLGLAVAGRYRQLEL